MTILYTAAVHRTKPSHDIALLVPLEHTCNPCALCTNAATLDLYTFRNQFNKTSVYNSLLYIYMTCIIVYCACTPNEQFFDENMLYATKT